MMMDTTHGRGKKLRLESQETFMNTKSSARLYLTDATMVSVTFKIFSAIYEVDWS